MPGISGRTLAQTILSRNPAVKILFMSGYTENAIVHHGVLDTGTHFLQKPFTPSTLAGKVREVLDHPATPGS
jgi:two-component system cell cycle sensor histidine kinase/response regulator CckA